LPPELLREGVYTASAGNMAQGLAWAAREIGVPCRVIAPDHAPQTKIDAIERLGASVRRVPFGEWWQALLDYGVPGEPGTFIHPGADPAVIAGNATIGLEILEQLPDVDTILVPYGSGGLACGIACAARAARPSVKVYAVEVETAAPFSASLAAGRPVTVEYTPSFVDGMGGKGVLEQMWPLAQRVLAGALVVSLRQVADALRMIAERTRVIAEGAGAAPLAAALAHPSVGQRVACVVSGGNIDHGKLVSILAGAVP
jgi:threonine dehydratase